MTIDHDFALMEAGTFQWNTCCPSIDSVDTGVVMELR